MVIKAAPAVYVSEELSDFLKELASDHKFNRWIEDMKSVLKGNMFAGECIPKRQIPKYYRDRYGVNNLYRYDHPEGFRSCYAPVKFSRIGVCPGVLDLRIHGEYDRIFGFRPT